MKLHTTSYGERGERIAFCHGLFGQGKNWTNIGKQLAASGYRVTLVDLPNHGQSEWTSTFSYVQMADALIQALDDIDPDEPWTLLGHSMGGKTVMLAALRHPQRLKRLVVVDMSPVSYAGLTTFGRYVEGMRALDLTAITTRADASAALMPYVQSDSICAFLLQNLRRQDGAFQWQMNLSLLGDSLPLLAGWPAEEIPADAQYTGPTLWIAGENSPYVKDEYLPTMRGHFPKTRLVTIKQTGHWPHSEKPDVFVQTMSAFLNATGADTGS